MTSPETSLARRTTPVFAILLASWFFFVSWDSLKAPFTAGELSAIYVYWHPPLLRLISSQFQIWRGYFRPFVGLLNVPTLLAFGLNPAAFHAVQLAVLLLGAFLVYRFARALGSDELTAGIAALIACYHGGLSNIYYMSVYISDALCGVFCLTAFIYYMRIRASGRLTSLAQTFAFLGLYLCALNSKEMAVTMPLMLLVYEWLYLTPPRLPLPALIKWLRGPGRVIFWTGLLNVVYIWGKRFGPYGLMKEPAYHPVYSRNRIIDFEERYLGDLFYHLPRFDLLTTFILWIVITWLAWRRNRPILRFCWFWAVLTPLPIMFLDGRDQACLYVTLAGWAVLAATLFTDFLPAATRVVGGEPLFRSLGRQRIRLILVSAAMLLWAVGSWRYKLTLVPALAELDRKIVDVLAQFRAVNPRVPHRARVVFLDDPLHTRDMAIIAELWFRDRSVQVQLNSRTPLSPPEIASADAVFTWKDAKLIRVR